MEIAKVSVSGVAATTVEATTIPAGIIGATIAVEYGPEWGNMIKNVSFRGAEDVTVVNVGSVVKLPQEVAAKPNMYIQIGFTGVSGDGTVLIPTLWAYLGTTKPASPVNVEGGSTPPVWAQVVAMIGDLNRLNTPSQDNLVNAINDAAKSGNNDVDLSGYVKSVNGVKPDAAGDVKITIPDSGQNVDLTGYAKEQWVQEGFQPKGEYLTEVPEGYAKTEDIPTKPEDIGAQPAGSYLTDETDPTVPAWAKQPKKPTYTASEVGARSADWMPTAQEVGALPATYTPPNQTAAQVGADPKGTAENKISEHNADTAAHNDIRMELRALSDRLNAFFDSDNQTLDELSEIVAYITSNKSLIDAITTSKVSVEDIVNNLTTNVANKPLSAAQGVVLKGLIDAVSNSLENYQPKGNYLTKETDPTVPAWAKESSKPSYSKSEVGLGNVDNVRQYSASNPPPYPVTSVNGQTGAVTVPVPTVPTGVMTKTEYSALSPDAVEQLYADGIRMLIVKDGYTNLVPKSTDAAGNVYQGCGYLNGYRLTSSGGMAASDNCCVSGYMPYVHGSTYRIVGSCGNALSNAGQYVGLYDADYGLIKMEYASSVKATWEPRADGLWEMTIDTSKISSWSNAKYFRVSCALCVGADLTVTRNEPIGLEV